MTRVIYLSNTKNGRMLLDWLRLLPCEIVLADTEDRKITEFPPYDLGISFLYTHKIPATEFTVPYKWVNFHPAPVPEFRGRNLAYQAIMQKASHFGATLFYMDVEFDTGEIIEVIRFPIEPYHTAGDLVTLSHNALVSLFHKWIPKLLNGKVESKPQGKGDRYYRKTPIDDSIELSEQQARKIRAVTVYPRFYATTDISGKKYKLVPIIED